MNTEELCVNGRVSFYAPLNSCSLCSSSMHSIHSLHYIHVTGTDMAAQGQLRAFLSFQQCRESLGLTKDKTYLIMGTSNDMYRNDNDQGWVCCALQLLFFVFLKKYFYTTVYWMIYLTFDFLFPHICSVPQYCSVVVSVHTEKSIVCECPPFMYFPLFCP